MAESPLAWSPTDGLAAPNGDLRLLEYAGPFAAHARRISRDGKEKTY